MQSKTVYYYWDASVFCSYVGGIPDRLPTIEAMLEEIAKNRYARIITSSISIVEVAFASGHGRGRRVPDREELIDNLWRSPTVELIDVTPNLLYDARDLMRRAVDLGLKVTPNDALHLGTAIWANRVIAPVAEIATYDHDWSRFAPLLNGLTVGEPHCAQPYLPYGISD